MLVELYSYSYKRHVLQCWFAAFSTIIVDMGDGICPKDWIWEGMQLWCLPWLTCYWWNLSKRLDVGRNAAMVFTLAYLLCWTWNGLQDRTWHDLETGMLGRYLVHHLSREAWLDIEGICCYIIEVVLQKNWLLGLTSWAGLVNSWVFACYVDLEKVVAVDILSATSANYGSVVAST